MSFWVVKTDEGLPIGSVEADNHEGALQLAGETYHTRPGESLKVREAQPNEDVLHILSRHKKYRHDHETHKIPVGALVRYRSEDGEITLSIGHDLSGQEVVAKIEGPVVLFVVKHTRDCNGTPLYTLSDQPISTPDKIDLRYKMFTGYLLTGASEERLEELGQQVTVRSWEQYLAEMRGY